MLIRQGGAPRVAPPAPRNGGCLPELDAGARRVDRALTPAYELLRAAPNPMAVKAALRLQGWDVGGLRLPLVEADENETAAVRGCLERLGVLEAAAA